MSDEKPEAKIARIDERTLNMDKKLDLFIDQNNQRHASHSTRLGKLEALENKGKGALWVLGVLWAVLGGFFVKHMFWDLDRATPAAAAAEVVRVR